MNTEIRPGFSERVYDPSIREALKKVRLKSALVALLLILGPSLIAGAISLSQKNVGALVIGIGVSAVFVIVYLILGIKFLCERQWDGVVTSQDTERRRRRSRGGRSHITYTVYVTRFETANGAKKKLVEQAAFHPYYDYLNVGDQVRFHPRMNSFYEKFDKTQDTYLYCAACRTVNDIAEERCKKCGAALVK